MNQEKCCEKCKDFDLIDAEYYCSDAYCDCHIYTKEEIVNDWESEFDKKFVSFGNGGSYEINMLIEHEVDDLKDFIKSLLSSTEKRVAMDIVQEIEKDLSHDENHFCKKYGEQFKECAKCYIERKLSLIKSKYEVDYSNK